MSDANCCQTLHCIKVLPVDNRFMDIMYQILRQLATVGQLLLLQMIGNKRFLQSQITYILRAKRLRLLTMIMSIWPFLQSASSRWKSFRSFVVPVTSSA